MQVKAQIKCLGWTGATSETTPSGGPVDQRGRDAENEQQPRRFPKN